MLFTVFIVLELHAQSAAAPKLKSARVLVALAVVTNAVAYGATVDEDIKVTISIIVNNERKLKQRVKCVCTEFFVYPMYYNAFDRFGQQVDM
jgi:hypothetical protein